MLQVGEKDRYYWMAESANSVLMSLSDHITLLPLHRKD